MPLFSSNIIESCITAFIGFVASIIFTNIIKPTWLKAKADKKKKQAFFLLLKYATMIVAISLSTCFIGLGKGFVLIVSILFSFTVLLIVYDYGIYFLASIFKASAKSSQAVEIKQLRQQLINLGNTPEEKKQKEVIQQKLDTLLNIKL